MKKIIAIIGLIFTGVLIAPHIASAHTAHANPSCEGLHVTAVIYPPEVRVVVMIDGVVERDALGGGVWNFPWTKHQNHAWSVIVDSPDGENGTQYDHAFGGEWKKCVKDEETTTTTEVEETTTTTQPEETTTTDVATTIPETTTPTTETTAPETTTTQPTGTTAARTTTTTVLTVTAEEQPPTGQISQQRGAVVEHTDELPPTGAAFTIAVIIVAAALVVVGVICVRRTRVKK